MDNGAIIFFRCFAASVFLILAICIIVAVTRWSVKSRPLKEWLKQPAEVE